jgi:nucleotide-binding universal stress UspA family protein
MLVMATHGRVGFKRVVMGSVAAEVIRGARGPVALIRPVDPAGESTIGTSTPVSA